MPPRPHPSPPLRRALLASLVLLLLLTACGRDGASAPPDDAREPARFDTATFDDAVYE